MSVDLEPLARTAEGRIGDRESPKGSNWGPDLEKYFAADDYVPGKKDGGYPWCAAFVSWCVQQYLAKQEEGLRTVAPRLAAAFSFRGWGIKNGAKVFTPEQCVPGKMWPQRGDIAVFKFSHVGIVSLAKSGEPKFYAVEGNTDADGSREGWVVARRARTLGVVREFVRILSMVLIFGFVFTVCEGRTLGESAAASEVRRNDGAAVSPRVWLNGIVATATRPSPILGAAQVASDEAKIGNWLGGAALALTSIMVILNFIRKESKMEEPKQERSISGGPVTIQHERECVEMRAHDALSGDFKLHKQEIWEVINGLRMAIGRIEADISAIKALREANGERLREVSSEVSELSRQVARLAGALEGEGRVRA